LLHGGGGTGKAFWAQLQYFASSYRVIAPDMPGFGRSEWIDDIQSVDQIPYALRNWLQILEVPRFILGGNSMGGRVALSFAARYPDMVSHLVILDSVGLTLPDVPVVNPLTLPPSRFMSGLVCHPEDYRDLTPYRTLDDARELNHGRQVFARYLGAQGIVPDPELDLSRIIMPTLLVWGREDRIIPLAYGKALEKALPQAELVVFDEVGHLPHIEAPYLTNQSIRNFLDRHPLVS
jgi:4,5:9,10-diseco-3-hydroxy-5,9,17-trioxoandrosta-1(10),2-diene-4-oate hydrolase